MMINITMAQRSKLLPNLSRPRLLDSENGEDEMHETLGNY